MARSSGRTARSCDSRQASSYSYRRPRFKVSFLLIFQSSLMKPAKRRADGLRKLITGMEVALESQSLGPPLVGVTAPSRKVAKPSPDVSVFGLTYVLFVGAASKPNPGLLKMIPCGDRLPRVSKPVFK